MNPIQEFTGKGVCGNPQLIHGIVFHLSHGEDESKFYSAQSFHPNKRGTTLYAQIVSEKLGDVLLRRPTGSTARVEPPNVGGF